MRVLIAEDDLVSRRVLEAALSKWGYEVAITGDGNEAWAILQQEDAPKLAILDWMMPGMDGAELCRRIRAAKSEDYTYVILLTAKDTKDDIFAGLDAGADDYVLKPFDREELKRRIRIGHRIIDLERRLTRLASTDALTGILNRRAFMQRLESDLNRSLRRNLPLGLILADIDRFKAVNDQYGHQAGDAVLRDFTQCLGRVIRAYDQLARYGGEEFAVSCPDTDISQTKMVAERMCETVNALRISLPGCDERIQITASFGITALRVDEHETVDSLIKRADGALYRAKSAGRAQVGMPLDDAEMKTECGIIAGVL